MSTTKKLPPSRLHVSALKRLANEMGQDIAVLYTFDAVGRIGHVVTWGRSVEQCSQAAEWGNKLKDALGWPRDLHAQPSRVKRLQAEVDALRTRLEKYEAPTTDIC